MFDLGLGDMNKGKTDLKIEDLQTPEIEELGETKLEKVIGGATFPAPRDIARVALATIDDFITTPISNVLTGGKG